MKFKGKVVKIKLEGKIGVYKRVSGFLVTNTDKKMFDISIMTQQKYYN